MCHLCTDGMEAQLLLLLLLLWSAVSLASAFDHIELHVYVLKLL